MPCIQQDQKGRLISALQIDCSPTWPAMSKMSFAANVSPASGPGETRHTNVFAPHLRLSIFTVMPPAIGGYIIRCRVTFDPGRRRHAISSSGIEANSISRVGFIVTNMSAQARGVVHFYNGRGTAEQWIKEGKYALNWTRLSCQRFVSSQVRLALFVLAYNLAIFYGGWFFPEESSIGPFAPY